jgi:quercetin dioxygenase-like cupin family protein
MAMFSLPPGGIWRHSDRHKSYYYADECYYLLAGELTMHNPETGDVAVLHAGEALSFRERTWHYGYNFTDVETIIICTFAPVPADISSAAAMAAAVPPLAEIRPGRWDLLGEGGYPWNADEARRSSCFRVLPPSDWLPIIQGTTRPIRVDLMVSTEKQTSGMFALLPGVTTDAETHPGDEVAFCVSGQASVYLPDTDEWFELHPRDGVFVRGGIPHRWYNTTGERATVFFGVAPRYR